MFGGRVTIDSNRYKRVARDVQSDALCSPSEDTFSAVKGCRICDVTIASAFVASGILVADVFESRTTHNGSSWF